MAISKLILMICLSNSSIIPRSYEVRHIITSPCCVKVINKGGLGPPSEEVFGETFMAEPSEQPQNVNVYTYKGQTVRVTWDPIEVKDGEAQLDGYRVS